jgi:hypothetical protein
VNVLQINKEEPQELSVVCVSLGAVADRRALQGPPTYITLKEDFHVNWETRERYGSTSEVPEGGTTNLEIKILEKSNIRHKGKEENFTRNSFLSGNVFALLDSSMELKIKWKEYNF